MILTLRVGDYWKTHHIALVTLSLVFAAVMIFHDWQESENVREGDARWLHLGMHLGIWLWGAFTIGALVNKLWSSFVIGLVALCFDARLLMRRIETTSNGSPKP